MGDERRAGERSVREDGFGGYDVIEAGGERFVAEGLSREDADLLVTSPARIARLEVENGRLRKVLIDLREWDYFDTSADGGYWRRRIAAALAAAGGETTTSTENSDAH